MDRGKVYCNLSIQDTHKMDIIDGYLDIAHFSIHRNGIAKN